MAWRCRSRSAYSFKRLEEKEYKSGQLVATSTQLITSIVELHSPPCLAAWANHSAYSSKACQISQVSIFVQLGFDRIPVPSPCRLDVGDSLNHYHHQTHVARGQEPRSKPHKSYDDNLSTNRIHTVRLLSGRMRESEILQRYLTRRNKETWVVVLWWFNELHDYGTID